MSAIATEGYVDAKLKEARQAKRRLVRHAANVFGDDAKEVVARLLDGMTARMRSENPDIFRPATPRRRTR